MPVAKEKGLFCKGDKPCLLSPSVALSFCKSRKPRTPQSPTVKFQHDTVDLAASSSSMEIIGSPIAAETPQNQY